MADVDEHITEHILYLILWMSREKLSRMKEEEERKGEVEKATVYYNNGNV